MHSPLHFVDIFSFPQFSLTKSNKNKKNGFPLSHYAVDRSFGYPRTCRRVAQCVQLQVEMLLHPQCTTRIRCMLPEVAETITWALLSIETPRSSCFPACLVFTGARTPGKTIGKDHGGLPNPTQVGLVCSHLATQGCASRSSR